MQLHMQHMVGKSVILAGAAFKIYLKQLYYHLTPISQTIQVRWTRHATAYFDKKIRSQGLIRKISQDEIITDVLLWAPTHSCASVG